MEGCTQLSAVAGRGSGLVGASRLGVTVPFVDAAKPVAGHGVPCPYRRRRPWI